MVDYKSRKLEECNVSSDKILHHGYHRFYPTFVDKFRNVSDFKMLELGYEKGHSIELWKNYFQNPIIHAIDIIDDPNDSNLNDYYKVDQSNNVFLDSFCKNNNNKYHFIIDDASHVPEYQWNTFIRFINLLNEGGVYIIEDVETSFWGRSNIYGYVFDSKKSSIFAKLEAIYHVINKEFIPWNIQRKFKLTNIEIEALSQIESITIAYNCIIFTKKDFSNYLKFYRDNFDYRFKQKKNSLKNRNLFKIKKQIMKFGSVIKYNSLNFFRKSEKK